ncbi:hypothetical protein, partial [Mesorhizobium sp. M1C.F.Ca.ET.189.01.1.1]|uniref:hypothetical protein n=1 Tax=Mesorhizobium sp. M1C.F.Ca.ET.189.01.1.1 TaxID=2563925 RepID=UPI001AEE9886
MTVAKAAEIFPTGLMATPLTRYGDSFDEALVKFDLRTRQPARIACTIASATGWTRVGAEGNVLACWRPSMEAWT